MPTTSNPIKALNEAKQIALKHGCFVVEKADPKGTRYRVRDGKLSFWFELIRQDKVLEAATQTLITTIREKTGNPFFFGEPFLA